MVNALRRSPDTQSLSIETFSVSLCGQLRADGVFHGLDRWIFAHPDDGAVLGTASRARRGRRRLAVSRSSGEVWMTATGTQQASLTQEEILKPGDTIRTGRNGRVLLGARRGNHSDLAEFGDRHAGRERRTDCRPRSCSRRARSCSRSRSATSSISRSRRRISPPWSRARISASR